VNLFWETRKLTQSREDHLTCFIAAALEVDDAFRLAYEKHVLAPLAADGAVPQIASVHTQVSFPEQHCCPDMMLVLADRRRVLCEHKIDAGETLLIEERKDPAKQLERYLEIPGIDAVAYFRSALSPPEEAVLSHPGYLRPAWGAAHFLWRDLYRPLMQGEHVLSAWLREGFERLGFTPPVPHIGALSPSEDEQVKENQRNFAKLWHATRSYVEPNWKVGTGSRCQLYLEPRGWSLASMVLLSPLSQGGSLLMVRAHAGDAGLARLRARLEAAAAALPVTPEVSVGRAQNGRMYVDVLASLQLVLGDEVTAEAQEARLFAQVVPLVDALLVDE